MMAGLIDVKLTAVMGHSMGGGATYITSDPEFYPNYPLHVSAIVTLSGMRFPSSDIYRALPHITVPSLIVGGTLDCIVKDHTEVLPAYHAINSSCKYHVNIARACHCHFAEIPHVEDDACLLTERALMCWHQPILSADEQFAMVVRYVVPFLNMALHGDAKTVMDKLMVVDISTGKLDVSSVNGCV